MGIGFIVMQIGNEELDVVCESAMVRALEDCGLEARRVDKHNEGDLLKSEIIRFIRQADVVIADLTNERPNVYLEIGYAMGVGKFRNLVLTVREDHFPDSPNFEQGGPKIHFDLAGYDILPWSPDALPRFRENLRKLISRRLTLLAPSDENRIWDDEWTARQRDDADSGLAALDTSGFMEVRAALHPPKPTVSQSDLNRAAQASPVPMSGWPIGVYLSNHHAHPNPRTDGIFATVKHKSGDRFSYWAIRHNGDFHTAESFIEDRLRPGELFFDIRITRVTESLLYLLRLYNNLAVDPSTRISVGVRHDGLAGRILTSSTPSRDLSLERRTAEDRVDSEITTTLAEIDTNLVAIVKDLISSLFMMFEFFELADSIYEDIVTRFRAGGIS